jgi:thermostable 8-oxoguanine DNA glycosylase
MKKSSARDRLLAIIRPLAAQKMREINRGKRNRGDLKRRDFIWHYLLQSFATMGRASGAKGLIKDQSNYQRVTYEALAALTPKKRERQVREACRAAKVRMPDLKARYILECFQYVETLGGPEKAKNLLLAQPGREGKIHFLRTFPGIGPKYARNIMMDVYQGDFRDSIALDTRIKSISIALGLSFSDSDYLEHEAFYLEVAHAAGLNGWELDRLLFNFLDEVKQGLKDSKAPRDIRTTRPKP